MTSMLNSAREAHVDQVRTSLLKDLQGSAPLAMRWSNRCVLVRPDGAARQYEQDLSSARWSLRRETTLDDVGHLEIALLRSYAHRADPVHDELPSMPDDQIDQARAWWATPAAPAMPALPPVQPLRRRQDIVPHRLNVNEAKRYTVDANARQALQTA